MASKSKRRRRVFRASCILAALIIAGSSFAWFTSKDEVTNRLTANSDYGVSIVESFVPPKNMLPGQEINKDVYAVNTGSIAAFVKEDVKGVLNYTYETKVNAWDADCVKLTLDQVKAIQGETTEDGFKTMEAGGYLAWTDATSTTTGSTQTYSVDGKEFTADELVAEDAQNNVLSESNDAAKTFKKKYVDGTTTYYMESETPTDGAKLYLINTDGDGTTKPVTYYVDSGKTLSIKNDTTTSPAITPGPVYSGRVQDITDPWTPTETGTYIFRRSIGGTSAAPTYTYAGYYYDKDENEYYKIVIGNDDDYRAAEDHNTTPVGYEFDVSVDSDKLGAGVTVNEDGSINGTPKIAFVKDVDVKDKQVNFKYEDASGEHGPRLVAEYAADLPTTTVDGVEYDASAMAARTEVDYFNKLGESNRATVDYEQNKADYDYAKALADARDILKTAAAARNTAHSNATSAQETLDTEWGELKQSALDRISDYGTNVRANFIGSYLVEDYTDPQSNTWEAKLFPAAAVATIKASADPEFTQAKANLTKLEGLQDDIIGLDGQLATELAKISGDTKLTPAQLDTIIANVQNLIDQMNAKVKAYKDAYSAIVDDDTTATALNINNDAAGKKAALQGLIDHLDGMKDDMDTDVTQYKTAYNNNETAKEAETTAINTWGAAIDTYNNTVGNPPVEAVEADPEANPPVEAQDAKPATGARGKYEAVVTKIAPTLQTPDALAYADHGTTIVPTYSANTAAGKDPQINKENALTEAGWQAIQALGSDQPSETTYSLTTKEATMNEALAATNAAKNDYDDAVEALNSASTIKIYVNLADDYATNWTIDPADVTTAGSQDVDFYLNSILDAGETSPKLIDSVELSDETTARAYKDLTFDLNVALDSAQITYGNDQRTITTEATEGWGMTPTLTTPTDIETAVTWAANA